MTLTDTERADQAAGLLFAAWTHPERLLHGLPEELRPTDEAQAYAIQQALSPRLGRIGGWKVGAANAQAPCTCAPMPLDGVHKAPARLPSANWRTRGVEAEIAVRLGHSLTPRAAPLHARGGAGGHRYLPSRHRGGAVALHRSGA